MARLPTYHEKVSVRSVVRIPQEKATGIFCMYHHRQRVACVKLSCQDNAKFAYLITPQEAARAHTGGAVREHRTLISSAILYKSTIKSKQAACHYNWHLLATSRKWGPRFEASIVPMWSAAGLLTRHYRSRVKVSSYKVASTVCTRQGDIGAHPPPFLEVPTMFRDDTLEYYVPRSKIQASSFHITCSVELFFVPEM